jgi:hypothetical protein
VNILSRGKVDAIAVFWPVDVHNWFRDILKAYVDVITFFFVIEVVKVSNFCLFSFMEDQIVAHSNTPNSFDCFQGTVNFSSFINDM